MGASIAFGFLLLVLSAILVWHHKHVWDQARVSSPGARDKEFARRQYRRRTQTSALIGFVGAAISLQPWISSAVVATYYVTGLILAVLWILLLGIADMVSSLAHFQRARRRQVAEQAATQALLRREIDRRRARGGGTAPAEDGGAVQQDRDGERKHAGGLGDRDGADGTSTPPPRPDIENDKDPT
ncbi:MAG: hypothetical protein FJ295_15930 [Planctomycetes bacterium]|nr:hypothetical protein [Planctomycetota bacterium]